MKKILVLLFALIVLVFGAQNLYAADKVFKNSLLKMEISELDDLHYNIELYTQKIYNEPVKIIQKSDNIYYFLLPETDHSITSTPKLGAITNILIKTYPYAGQDLNNGYTKVAIITSKPVNLTTSMKVLDSSISPRLDPLRLAKLDNVFERYSNKLAQNNIKSPLNEFRKEQNTQIASGVQPKTIPSGAKNVEEYSNSLNKKQAAQKQPAAQKPVAQKQPAIQKPIAIAQKPVAQKPVVQKSVTIAQKPVAQKPKISQKQAALPPKQTLEPSIKEKINSPAQTKIATTIPLTKPEKPSAASNQTASTTDKIQSKQRMEAEKFEKELPAAKPVEVEFERKDAPKEAKNIEVEIPAQTQPESNKAENQPAPSDNDIPIYYYLVALLVLFALYRAAKIKRIQKENIARPHSNINIKDLLKKTGAKEANLNENNQNVLSPYVPALNSDIELTENTDNETHIEDTEAPLAQNQDTPQEENNIELSTSQEAPLTEEEKINAFNSYMATLQEDEEQPTIITKQTPDDEVIKELYTPIESIYEEYNEPAQYNNEDNLEESATIVSSSKLTETRGLYLAKFEGATSLVGYIQDDIYVLYNFGEEEIKETEIESNLAEETETDSLYIVKTGGKKLMVKSTPYDMSLEMVM